MELATETPIGLVRVYNRADCCQERLANYEVWVGAAAGQTATPALLCAAENAPSTDGPFDTECGGKLGRFVTILLPGSSRTLNLAEVEVFEAP